jgi:hypothetical protein
MPGPDTRVALLLSDTLNLPRTDELSRWIDAGGTLVVADPESSFNLTQPVGSTQNDPLAKRRILSRACPLPALRDVARIDPSGGLVFDQPPGGVGCFPFGHGFFVTAASQGEGNVVSIGGPAVFVNSLIGKHDNSVLAASLLAAQPGGHITFFDPRHLDPGVSAPGGRKSLRQLVPGRFKRAFVQLAVAFGLFVLLRGRRLGRPVLEPQAVQLAGSEIVVAVGNLLQQAKQRDAAGNLLRAELRRTLTDRLGLSPDAPDEVVADQAASRAHVDRDAVLAGLRPTPLAGEPALVALAQSIESVRQEVDHAR